MTSVANLEENEKALLRQFRESVAEDVELLASLQSIEPTVEILRDLQENDFPAGLGLRLQSPIGKQAVELMQRALAAIGDSPAQTVIDELAVDFAAIYLNFSFRTSPCESVWCDKDGLTHQTPMFQVREWYKNYGLAAENWRVFADDHLVLQLKFIAYLFKLDEKQETLRESARFMDEHLLRWIGKFAQKVENRCATPYFAALTRITTEYLEEVRTLLVQLLGEPRPESEEIEKRMVCPPEVELPACFASSDEPGGW